MTRVLVTGAAGFLGHHLTRALRRRGYDVEPVDDLRVPPLLDGPTGLRLLGVAALTPAHLRGIDGVFHLAAWRSVPESFHDPARYEENVKSSGSLFAAAGRARVARMILASSCEVYGVARNIPTSEDEPVAPRSPYARSKVAVEREARRAADRGDFELRIARLFNLYGPGHRPDTVIAGLCWNALTGRPLPVEAPGTQRRDFSYVDFAVDRLIGMYECAACPQLINIGSGRSTSVLELVEHVRRIVPNAPIRQLQGRPNEIAEFRADTKLADSVLGPLRGEPLETGMAETLNWWRAHLEDARSRQRPPAAFASLAPTRRPA